MGTAVNEFGLLTSLPLLFGAGLSAGAGWFGMDVATKSNVVTVEAADQSINEGLRMAFKSGSIMGFSVTGFGITGLSIYWIYRAVLTDPQEVMFGNISQDLASELPVSHYLHVWVVVYTRSRRCGC